MLPSSVLLDDLKNEDRRWVGVKWSKKGRSRSAEIKVKQRGEKKEKKREETMRNCLELEESRRSDREIKKMKKMFLLDFFGWCI